MKKLLLILFCIIHAIYLCAQQQVPQQQMEQIYDEVKTPYKYGLAVAPTDNYHKIDCPTVFRQGDKWLMTYVVYNGKGGTDGRGYETWIAQSDNLLEWHTLGRVLSYRDGKWDCNQRGGFPALPDMEWAGSYELQTYKNRHWMTYIGGEGTGYEAVKAPLFIGLASTKNDVATAHEWESADWPILSINDKDVQWWESMTQYKSTVYWDKDKTLGAPFVMFYNAGGRNPKTNLKGERVGIALSNHMKTWRRYGDNPVFAHEADGTITGDAHIQKMGNVYVMFYFSAFDPSRKYKAFNTFAASYDLVNWTDWTGADLIVPSKDYDELFAHKSYVVKHNGVVYHFYCAVNNAEQRGIAVATSKPMGRSSVRFPKPETKNRRTVIELNNDWKTWLSDATHLKGMFATQAKTVNIPHNWDDYYGYRQLTHGNMHGTAMYVKQFDADIKAGKRYFMRFEGIGTYATIKLNNISFGRHIVGRTTLTLDVSHALKHGENQLEIKVEHPEMIADSPWVCGGCSSEWGFSEGSQPFGIFRPVVLEETDEVCIEPFGVHIWNNDSADSVFIETEIKNYGKTTATIEMVNKFSNADGKQVFRMAQQVVLLPGESKTICQQANVENPTLWDNDNPYLYKLATMIKRNSKTTDEVSTPFGIRTISWPIKRNNGDGRFYINGKPLFINGVCEYEHQFGQSHAFSAEQVAARVKQIRAAGFNAFRDAHQPHNLDYQKYFDRDGILLWTQFSAHVWYDTPEFRKNFKQLLRQWVKERRNSPSVVMWGLQNESTLPRDFAQECSNIIRQMDPTARSMRVVTTCNGGEGTDWNVIQNWSGTYGGDVSKYRSELSQPNQLLNGEYGAWRSIDLHTEPCQFEANGIWSENRMCQLLETKIRLASQAKDSVCGQFQWIYSSHDNPGRRQADEAYRTIDKVGPFNYKGLVTPWEEPLDAYYMYRANYVPAQTDPMVYLVSHTWANRFESGSRQATIEAYSNCDSVLLFNDAVNNSALLLGSQSNVGVGHHFIWPNCNIRYNTLRAQAYYKGKMVAEDLLVLNGLESAPNFEKLYSDAKPILKGNPDYNYLYRINCGGDDYTDTFGQLWMQDNTNFSHSWSEHFTNLNPYLASQRITNDPIRGTRDWSLLQHFRFGRHKLEYHFPVANGTYRVELYFIEPWHGTGGGASTDCEGLRIFDVAINDSLVIDDLDIWAESGHDAVCKKVVFATVNNGILKIHFPEVKAGQAVISAIAVASTDQNAKPTHFASPDWSWTAANNDVQEKTPKESLPEDKNARLSVTYEAEEANSKGIFQKREHRKQTGVFFGKGKSNSIEWNISTGLAQVYALRFKYMNTSQKPKPVTLRFVDAKGVVLKMDTLTFVETPEKWKMVSTTTGTYINAGHYRVILSSDNMDGLAFDALDIQ